MLGRCSRASATEILLPERCPLASSGDADGGGGVDADGGDDDDDGGGGGGGGGGDHDDDDDNDDSLPEFMNFKLFGKTILVVNIKSGYFFWAIHSASEMMMMMMMVIWGSGKPGPSHPSSRATPRSTPPSSRTARRAILRVGRAPVP